MKEEDSTQGSSLSASDSSTEDVAFHQLIPRWLKRSVKKRNVATTNTLLVPFVFSSENRTFLVIEETEVTALESNGINERARAR